MDANCIAVGSQVVVELPELARLIPLLKERGYQFGYT